MGTTALQGSLDGFKLPDLLAFLNATKKTGMLTVTSDDREAYVFFRSGSVVYAAGNQVSLRLGSILLRKKKITRPQAEIYTVLYNSDHSSFHSGVPQDAMQGFFVQSATNSM